MANEISVEVIYALPAKQELILLTLPSGSTVEQAIIASDLFTLHPQLKLSQIKVGIFSHAVELSQPLQNGDRVEIYRDLMIDPKTARRLRSSKNV